MQSWRAAFRLAIARARTGVFTEVNAFTYSHISAGINSAFGIDGQHETREGLTYPFYVNTWCVMYPRRLL